MDEEEGKQEEEKLEFTPEGETLGYISLDQARVLAMEHARDNPAFYGRRYARRNLVWEVLSQEENEDYYESRRSYRTAEGFRGEPGIEQFTIDKTDPIRLRQILAQPVQPRRLLVPITNAGVLAAVGALIGGLFAAGVFSGGTEDVTEFGASVTLEPGVGAELVSPNGDVPIRVDAETVDSPSRLTYRPLSSSEIPGLPASFKATGKAFDITIDAELLKPITIIVRISEADATLAGSDESNIHIQRHHNGGWELMDTAVDFGVSTATAKADSLSMFVLTVRKPEATPTLGPTPPSAPTATSRRRPPTCRCPLLRPRPSPRLSQRPPLKLRPHLPRP